MHGQTDPKAWLLIRLLTSTYTVQFLTESVSERNEVSVTVFTDPIQRIKEKKTARVPILTGANQDDGTLFTVGVTSLADFLTETFGSLVSVDQVRAAYPSLNDTEIIPTVARDFEFLWCAPNIYLRHWWHVLKLKRDLALPSSPPVHMSSPECRMFSVTCMVSNRSH